MDSYTCLTSSLQAQDTIKKTWQDRWTMGTIIKRKSRNSGLSVDLGDIAAIDDITFKIRFGFFAFNDISTFVGYLMPKTSL